MGRDKKWYRKQRTQEVICTTHGHELRGRGSWRVGATGWRGDKEGKIGKTIIA